MKKVFEGIPTETMLVHIDKINVGDTIILDNKLTTVGRKNIKHCKFMGKTLFGDGYNLGYKLVEKVVKLGARNL